MKSKSSLPNSFARTRLTLIGNAKCRITNRSTGGLGAVGPEVRLLSSPPVTATVSGRDLSKRWKKGDRSREAVTEYPYESPNTSNDSAILPQNKLGQIGFALSLIGVLGVFLVGPFGSLIGTVGMCVAFISLPGLAVSAIGLRRQPRRLAGWGVALGIFGSLYLPTFCLSLLVFPYS